MNLSFDPIKTKVILIGTSEYSDDFSCIPNVQNNIQKLSEIISSPEIIGVPSKNIFKLINIPSKSLVKEIKKISDDLNISTLIIYYSGHGFRTDSRKLYLTTIDTEKTIPEISSLDADIVKNWLDKIPIRRKILILDCCHSGIVTLNDNSYTDYFKNIEGTFILASSPPEEASFFHPKEEYTFFTKELINILEKGLDIGKDAISVNDIFRFLAKKLNSRGLPVPRKKDNLNISDFNIAKNVNYNLETLKKRALYFFNNRDFDNAINAYKKLILIDSKNQDFHKQLSLIQIEKKYAELHEKANLYFYKKRNYALALNYYKEALKIREEVAVKINVEKCKEFLEIQQNKKRINIPKVFQYPIIKSVKKSILFVPLIFIIPLIIYFILPDKSIKNVDHTLHPLEQRVNQLKLNIKNREYVNAFITLDSLQNIKSKNKNSDEIDQLRKNLYDLVDKKESPFFMGYVFLGNSKTFDENLFEPEIFENSNQNLIKQISNLKKYELYTLKNREEQRNIWKIRPDENYEPYQKIYKIPKNIGYNFYLIDTIYSYFPKKDDIKYWSKVLIPKDQFSSFELLSDVSKYYSFSKEKELKYFEKEPSQNHLYIIGISYSELNFAIQQVERLTELGFEDSRVIEIKGKYCVSIKKFKKKYKKKAEIFTNEINNFYNIENHNKFFTYTIPSNNRIRKTVEYRSDTSKVDSIFIDTIIREDDSEQFKPDKIRN
ncbi:MAG: caspase family protein [Chitinophagales bacterium]|nr:caspase family protein [Chitinophagales bacterium]